jgi:hypothetical protein
MARIALIVTFLAVAFPTSAGADCVLVHVATVARSADAIFSGTVTDIDDLTVTFEVDQVWKGSVTKRLTVYLVPSTERLALGRARSPAN